MGTNGSPERVYVENEWYDGPRAGIADVDGVPHRFKCMFDEANDDYLGTFLVWPIDRGEFDLEIEQWGIFVEWNRRYELGEASIESHPGHGGVNSRWDELEALLKPTRSNAPAAARRAVVEVHRIERDCGYELTGPDYALQWSFV